MTYLHDGTEYLNAQERRIYEAVGYLTSGPHPSTGNNSQLARVTGIGRTTVGLVCHHLKARGFLRDVSKGAAYHWRQTDKPVAYWPPKDEQDLPGPGRLPRAST